MANSKLKDALGRQAAVALLGPRQVGKTTLAYQIAEASDAIYLDLENPEDRQKLERADAYFREHEAKLIVLDEIHRAPELFARLRGVIDRQRRQGSKFGRFLILGSASIDLLKQSSESLAGRLAYVELGPLNILETGGATDVQQVLWLRGGFPDSFLARHDSDSYAWRQDFIRTYLERDVPMFGPRVPAETLRRLWTMMAHGQGTQFNASELARSLSISATTVSRYIDLLVDLLLVRRLPPYFVNVGKRLVKSPKLYVRDSGIQHALLGITTMDDLLGHPVVGASWEGFVIENIISVLPLLAQPFYYRTAAGAEIDLLLEFPGGERWAIEIKSASTKPLRGFHEARDDLKPTRSFVVHAGSDRFEVSDGIEAISLHEIMNLVAAAGDRSK